MKDRGSALSQHLDPLARYAPWCLAGVLVCALGLRLLGIGFGLPYLEHPDEPFWIFAVLKMIKAGDPNPHDFIYPSFYYYLSALGYLLYYWIGQLSGAFHSLADLKEPILLIGGSGKIALLPLVLIGRSISIALGVGTVALTFDLGRRLTGFVLGGTLAAAWVAVSPTMVANDRYMVPDGPLAFLTTLTLWAAWRIFERGRTRDYLLAGVAVGLATGTKYNAGLFVLVLLLAHFLRVGWRGLKDWRLYAALLASAAIFLATTPYAILDFQTFLKGAFIDIRHYAGGHAGNTGNSLAWYLGYFWRMEGPVLVLAAAGIVWGVWRRAKGPVMIAAMTLAYLLFISAFAVHFERTALPLIPLFALLAAWWAASLRPPLAADRPSAYPGAAVALIAIALAFPLVGTVRDTVRLTTPDSLDTAREWIDGNVPPGARVAVESYSPYVDPQRYVVQGLYKLSDHPPEWYTSEGYDYLVVSQRMFRRFYADPVKFAAEIARYEALFSALEEVKVFNDGGYEVRIYRVPRS